ncbi:hypothetical protein Tco_0086016 [Tanacetum coccineum]
MLSSKTETCLTYTHFFSQLTYYMAYGENEARQAIVLKLQREIQAEETLAHQLLCNLTRYTEEMHNRSLQITRLQTLPTTSRNTYGLHALLMTLEADIRTTNIILRTRQQLLRSISAKQNFVNNYMANIISLGRFGVLAFDDIGVFGWLYGILDLISTYVGAPPLVAAIDGEKRDRLLIIVCFEVLCNDAAQVTVNEAKTADGACYLEVKVPSRSRRDGWWDFRDRYGYHYDDGIASP